MYLLCRNHYTNHLKKTSTMVADPPATMATNAYAAATCPRWSLPLVLYQTTP